MSEIKQEILDLLILNGRKPQTIKSGERVVYLYDALNIVNKEFSKTEQPQLNPNQQIVLEWLKEQVSIGNDLQYVLWEFTDNVYEEPAEYSVSEQTKAWLELTEQEQFQVLAAFAEWGSKEEER